MSLLNKFVPYLFPYRLDDCGGIIVVSYEKCHPCIVQPYFSVHGKAAVSRQVSGFKSGGRIIGLRYNCRICVPHF